MQNLKMAESLVAVHTHTHILLLNEKINKFYILLFSGQARTNSHAQKTPLIFSPSHQSSNKM